MDFQAIAQLSDEVFAEALRSRPGPQIPLSTEARQSREHWRQITERSAVAGVFDQAIYEQAIAVEGGPRFSFQRFLERGSAEAVSQLPGFYRSLLSPSALPATEVAAVHAKVAEAWATRIRENGADPIWRLPHLIGAQSEEAVPALRALLDAALDPEALQLDRAERILGVVASASSTLHLPIKAAYDEGLARVSTRKFFADDYYKSGRYFRRDPLHRRLAGFCDGQDWLLPIHAAGGTGKTMFLRRVLTREWLPAGTLVARIDFDTFPHHALASAPWLTLLSLSEQLLLQLPHSSLERFLSYREEWGRALAGTANPSTTSSARVQVRGSAAVERGDSMSEFADAFAAGLPAGRLAIVIFDTTEKPYLRPPQPFSALLELFEMIRANGRNLKVILAGRYDLFARKASDGLERVENLAADYSAGRAPSLAIEGFTDEETATVLRKAHGLEDLGEERSRIVYEKCRDHTDRALPFDVALWARELRAHPEWTADQLRTMKIDLHYLVERVLEHIPDYEVRWLVRYGALPRKVNLPLAAAVLLPEVRRQRALREDEQARKDTANAGLPRPAYDGGVVGDRPAAEVWAALIAYASGPEEGWINPVSHHEEGRFTLHPRVLQPMRRLVEEQPVWQDLHDAIQRWFEKEAARAGSIGDEPWTAAMCEALFHAFQLGAERGVALWYQLLGALKPIQWKVAARLAEVVLTDAGFEPGEDEPVPVRDLRKERRVPAEIEAGAAVIWLRAALWNFALEEEPAEMPRILAGAGVTGRRWQATKPDPAHPFHAALAALPISWASAPEHSAAVAETLAKAAAAHGASPDGLLLALLLARLHEARGLKDLAMEGYAAVTTSPRLSRWSQAPVSKRRLMILQTRAMSRLRLADEKTGQAIEALLREPIDSPAEDAALRLQAAEAWLGVGQPKRAASMLASGFRGDCVPVEAIARAHLLRAECSLHLWRLDAAAKSLAAVAKSWVTTGTLEENYLKTAAIAGDSVTPEQLMTAVIGGGAIMAMEHLPMRLSWALWQGAVHSRRAECKEALEVWRSAFDEALSHALFDHAWKIGLALARHCLLEAKSVNDCRYLLGTLQSIAGERRAGLDETIRLNGVLALARLHLRLAIRTGQSLQAPETQTWVQQLEEVAKAHPQPVGRASALATLWAHGLGALEPLLDALHAIQPESARLLALDDLDHPGLGAEQPLPEKAGGLFQNAFVDEKLKPPSISPARLCAAGFYRLCGARTQARELIDSVARTAHKDRNAALWREASHAAFRLQVALEGPVPTARQGSALGWVLFLEETERRLDALSGSVARGPLTRLRSRVVTLLESRAFGSLVDTGYIPRILEVAARVLALEGRRTEASSRWLEAAAAWQKLGESVRASHCTEQASLGQAPSPAATMPAAADGGAALEVDSEDCVSLDFVEGMRLLTWRGVTYQAPLPEVLGRMLGDHALRNLYQRITKSWTNEEASFLADLGVSLEQNVLPSPKLWALANSSHLGVNLVPWELLAFEHVDTFFRGYGYLPERAPAIDQWIEQAIIAERAGGERIYLAGITDPRTLLELVELGITGSRTMGEVLRALRSRRTEAPASKPSVLILPSAARPDATADAHLYLRAGLGVVWTLETAKVKALAAPLIHLRCPIQDSSDTGDTQLLTAEPMRVHDLRDLIKEAHYAPGAPPVVLLDVELQPSDDRENKRAILRRNHFCRQLWDSGLVSGIVATCHGDQPAEAGLEARTLEIAQCAARRASLADTARMLRSEKWSPLARATALWTWHPELPFWWDIQPMR